MADIQAFINQWNGQNGVGDTPQNDGECVGLVEKWLDANGWPHIWGNACDLPNNADRGAYDIIPNTTELVPKPGWIGVLPAGWGGSSVGHTFVVAPGTNQQTLIAFEQNDRIGGGDGRCRLFEGAAIEWPAGLVFIVPKALGAPAPPPAAPPAAPAVPVEAPPDPPAPAVPAPSLEPSPAETAPDPAPVAPVAPVETVPSDVSVNDVTPTTAPEAPILPSVSKDDSMNNSGALKAGVKTTEFWVSVALLALPLLNLALGAHISADSATLFVTTMASALGALVGPISYIRGRTQLKAGK